MTRKEEEWKPIEKDDDLEIGEDDSNRQRILVEVVSALYVPSMDRFSDADPYVSVSMEETKLHRTKVIPNNSNPIWTLETGSLFLIEYDKKKVNPKKNKVTFVLKDYDIVQKAKVLGRVDILLKDLM
jgi:Ca2+-dependent lipid-binding protein